MGFVNAGDIQLITPSKGSFVSSSDVTFVDDSGDATPTIDFATAGRTRKGLIEQAKMEAPVVPDPSHGILYPANEQDFTEQEMYNHGAGLSRPVPTPIVQAERADIDPAAALDRLKGDKLRSAMSGYMKEAPSVESNQDRNLASLAKTGFKPNVTSLITQRQAQEAHQIATDIKATGSEFYNTMVAPAIVGVASIPGYLGTAGQGMTRAVIDSTSGSLDLGKYDESAASYNRSAWKAFAQDVSDMIGAEAPKHASNQLIAGGIQGAVTMAPMMAGGVTGMALTSGAENYAEKGDPFEATVAAFKSGMTMKLMGLTHGFSTPVAVTSIAGIAGTDTAIGEYIKTGDIRQSLQAGAKSSVQMAVMDVVNRGAFGVGNNIAREMEQSLLKQGVDKDVARQTAETMTMGLASGQRQFQKPDQGPVYGGADEIALMASMPPEQLGKYLEKKWGKQDPIEPNPDQAFAEAQAASSEKYYPSQDPASVAEYNNARPGYEVELPPALTPEQERLKAIYVREQTPAETPEAAPTPAPDPIDQAVTAASEAVTPQSSPGMDAFKARREALRAERESSPIPEGVEAATTVDDAIAAANDHIKGADKPVDQPAPVLPVEPVNSLSGVDPSLPLAGELSPLDAQIAHLNGLQYKTPELQDLIDNPDGMDPEFHSHTLEAVTPRALRYNDLMTAVNGNPLGAELQHHTGEGRYASIFPSNEPGRFRASYFDKNGFYSHETHDTLQQVAKEVADQGFTKPSPGKLDELAVTRSFQLGNEKATLTGEMNAGNITWQERQSRAEELDKTWSAHNLPDKPATPRTDEEITTGKSAATERMKTALGEKGPVKPGSAEESFAKRFPDAPWLRAEGVFQGPLNKDGSVNPNHGEFERSPRLCEENKNGLTPEQAAVEDALFKRLIEDPHKMMQEYLNMAHPVDKLDAEGKPVLDAKGKPVKVPGNRSLLDIMRIEPVIINPDEGRALSNEYDNNPGEFSGATHEPISALVKMIGAEAMAIPDPRGINQVLALSGGGGSGKGSSMDKQAHLDKIQKQSQIIFDGTMAKESKLKDIIAQASLYKKELFIAHIHRDNEGAIEGIVGRKHGGSKAIDGKIVAGRDVKPWASAEAHFHSGPVFLKMAMALAGTKGVKFIAVDKENGPAHEISLVELRDLLDTKIGSKTASEFRTLHEDLYAEAELNPKLNLYIEGGKYHGTLNTRESERVQAENRASESREPTTAGIRGADEPSGSGTGSVVLPEPERNGGSGEESGVTPPYTKGRSGFAYTESGEKIGFHYGLVEADVPITSHDPGGNSNPKFNSENQPRSRDTDKSRLQIMNLAAKPRVEQLTSSAKVSSGSPFVGRDMQVDSGNGRANGIRLGYKNGTMDEYRQYLVDTAADYGYTAEQVQGMKNPILVRVRETDVNRSDFAREANTSGKSVMSPAENARADAARLNDGLLGMLEVPGNGDILAASNSAFVAGFLKNLTAAESDGLVDRDGRPTKQAADRIQAAIFAKVYSDPKLISMMAEESDVSINNIINGLVAAAPSFARAGDKEVTKLLTDAIAVILEAKARKLSFNDLINQPGMFDAERDPAVVQVATLINSMNRSGKKLGEPFKRLAEITERNKEFASQDNMFGEPAKTRNQIIAEAFKTTALEEKQQSLTEQAPAEPEAAFTSYRYTPEGWIPERTTMPASEALSKFDERIDVLKALLDCVGGAL